MKARCETCPARNSRVKLIEVRNATGMVTRRLVLCPACHQVLNRMLQEEHQKKMELESAH